MCTGWLLLKAITDATIAVLHQPWLDEFSCEGHLAGTVLVHPHGVGTPPFAIEYSQVGVPVPASTLRFTSRLHSTHMLLLMP